MRIGSLAQTQATESTVTHCALHLWSCSENHVRSQCRCAKLYLTRVVACCWQPKAQHATKAPRRHARCRRARNHETKAPHVTSVMRGARDVAGEPPRGADGHAHAMQRRGSACASHEEHSHRETPCWRRPYSHRAPIASVRSTTHELDGLTRPQARTPSTRRTRSRDPQQSACVACTTGAHAADTPPCRSTPRQHKRPPQLSTT